MSYYDEYRFADVFARLQRAPAALAPRLAAIPGVGFAQTRIVRDVKLDVPRLSEPAIGHVVSIDGGRGARCSTTSTCGADGGSRTAVMRKCSSANASRSSTR